MTAELEAQVHELSRLERLQLREFLDATLIDDDDSVPESHLKVLSERMRRYENGESEFLSREEFEARMQSDKSSYRNAHRD